MAEPAKFDDLFAEEQTEAEGLSFDDLFADGPTAAGDVADFDALFEAPEDPKAKAEKGLLERAKQAVAGGVLKSSPYGVGPALATMESARTAWDALPTKVQESLQAGTRGTEGLILAGLAPVVSKGQKVLAKIPEPVVGIGRSLVDILSRTNYAVAGAADELFQGRSVTAAAGRALRELGSGLGSIKGDKEAFGEVLEQAGMPTVTLAEALPLLEGTWVGQVGSRGTLGLGLDVLADPLNLVSGGPAKTILTKAGKLGVTKAGLLARNAIKADMLKVWQPVIEKAVKSDALLGTLKRSQIEERVLLEANEKFAATYSRKTHPQYFDRGGLKVAGKSIVPGSAIDAVKGAVDSGVREPLAKLIATTERGKRVLEGTQDLADGMARMFNVWGDIGGLPEKIKGPDGVLRSRDLAIYHRRNFANARAAIAERSQRALHRGLQEESTGRWIIKPGAMQALRRAQKADKGAAKRIYRAVEVEDDAVHAQRMAALSADERHAAESLVELSRMMRDTMVRAGILEDGDLPARFLVHEYNNLDDLAQFHGAKGARDTASGSQLRQSFLKGRVFKSAEEAETVSARLAGETAYDVAHARAQGKAARAYPKLEFDYDGLIENTEDMIQRYSDVLSRKGWQEQVTHDFGVPAAAWDVNAHYEIAGRAKLNAGERSVVDTLVPRKAGFADVLKADRAAAVAQIRGAVAQLSRPTARREMVRRMMLKTTSQGELNRLADAVADVDPTLLPKRTVLPNEADAWVAERFGPQAGRYETRVNGFSDGTTHLPKLMWDDFEHANSRLWEHPGKIRALIDGYDRVANLWRFSVYGAWRFGASGFRNAYSSGLMGYMDLGLGVLNQATRAQSARVIAGAYSEKALQAIGDGTVNLGRGGKHRLRDLVAQFRDTGIIQPGKAFVEPTGQAKVGRRLAKLMDFGSAVENDARVVIALGNMRRGMTVREAADHVADFAFNYGELSQVERSIIRRLVGFPTFLRKNLELHARQIMRDPSRVINPLKPIRGEHSENERLTSWEGEAYKFRLDNDGKTLHVLTGIDPPIRALDTFWRGDAWKTLRGAWGILLPLFKTPAELAANVDFFTGRQLTRREMNGIGYVLEQANTPKSIMRFLDHDKSMDAAGRVHHTFNARKMKVLVDATIISRVVSTTDRQFREYMEAGGTPSLWKIVLDVLTGLREKELNLDEQVARTMDERTKVIEDMMLRQGKAREFRNVYVPKDKR